MTNYFNVSVDTILKKFSVTNDGLSEQQVKVSKEENGLNMLLQAKKESVFIVFLKQFQDLLVLILIAAAVISMLSGNPESTIVIFAVIMLNAFLGTAQHFKAQKSLDSLKALSSPIAKVIRDGMKQEIDSKNVVVGDIVLLEAGDLVVADGRLIENYSLQVNESMLTGESINVDKTTKRIDQEEVALGDQLNMVFSGSLVTYGRGLLVVTDIGMSTQIGKIATLMNQTQQKKTPLQVNLDNFSKKLAFVIMGICAVVFFLGVYRKMPVLDSLMFAVALAVAAIPEALSSIVTIVLAMGTQKMVKENAIIKELKAVESLGCVSVICSDKTGTLTQNKMTVEQFYVDKTTLNKTDLSLDNKVHEYLLNIAVLANDSTVIDGKAIGDPTEFAMVEWAHKNGVNELELRNQIPRMGEIPFDSERKLMSTVHCIDNEQVMLTKGALDVMIHRTTKILTSNGVVDITKEDIKQINQENRRMSENGLRVLAFGYKNMQTGEKATLESENDYIFVGLLSMIDPPREESMEAVANATKAGIRTIMITGDHKITATAIAKQIGIFRDGDIALTGVELQKLTEEELNEKLENISVYARVSPEHKIRIVNA
ncbi:MAG: HAD-IC family P-type ATPase, partial [Oscillospiraceae bacterium]